VDLTTGLGTRKRLGRRSIARAGSAYSALIARAARATVPEPLRAPAYRAFARAVGADLSEVELPLPAYASLGEFFTRKLRDGARPIDLTPGAIVAPCDGVIAAIGTADEGLLFQAKGRDYRLGDLLADEAWAAALTGGAYATIYLSPRDYHRVHTPADAQLTAYEYVPGLLFPVMPRVVNRVDGVFARNERVIIQLDSRTLGKVAVVMVGAAGVGNIVVTHGPSSASLRKAHERRRVEVGSRLERGDELGAFRLGSTVILVFEPGRATLAGSIGQAVKFGERMGSAIGGRA
jgi:phosphatidylserine decarboxylase